MGAIIPWAYLISAILFVVGLKLTSAPRTALQGNLVGAAGMLIAILATLFDPTIENYLFVALGLIGGTVIGTSTANQTPAKAMPQMVGMLNGLGGGASILVAFSCLLQNDNQPIDTLIAVGLSGVFGSITLCASLIAYAKLREWPFFEKPFPIPQQQTVNLVLIVFDLLLIAALPAFHSTDVRFICCLLIAIVSSGLGIIIVNPLRGIDMPVFISLMNACSGIAVAATGFVLDNTALIISGSLVSASSITLTQLMCKAMNRSLSDLLIGITAENVSDSNVRQTCPEKP